MIPSEEEDGRAGNREGAVARVIAGMTMSLDGFVADGGGSVDLHFVTDGVASAVAQAAAAAGDRAVTVVGGASLIRQLLEARVVDELQVDVMPVQLAAGLRLFDAAPGLQLRKVDVQEIGPRTSLRVRVDG